jgi:superfamily II DNA/RNA helicase
MTVPTRPRLHEHDARRRIALARAARRAEAEREKPAIGEPADHQSEPTADLADLAGPAPLARVSTEAPRTFADLGLPADLVAVLAERGLRDLFPIQAAALPDGLAGRDVLGRGRTGSGKTLTFGLATLVRVATAHGAIRRRDLAGRPRALVLVPTRELAVQVTEALTPYADVLGLRIATVVGGLSMGRQIDALQRGSHLVVATPGRLTDLIERGACQLGEVAVTVLDEADQMADMGFLPAVCALLDQVAPGGQRLLFSATLDGDVDELVRRYLHDPARHSVDPPVSVVETMSHHVLHLAPRDKREVTAQIAAREGRVIMFVRTKHGADHLTRHLSEVGIRAAALHGGKTQAVRNRTLERLRSGGLDALVATDVAARGIHVDDIDLVVNVDPPAEAKDYLHRSGRTARAGRSGTVVTLVLPAQRRGVSKMMATAGVTAATLRVEPGASALAEVTGARPPSGVPVVVHLGAETPPRAGGPGGRRRRSPGGTRPAERGRGNPAGGERRADEHRRRGRPRPVAR